MEIIRLGMYSFHNYSLKQLHATLQGQVGTVQCWKQHCSSPKEQNESSGGVNNDSCLHSTLHLETAKAASDIHRQFLLYLLAKCSHLYREMWWIFQEKSRTQGAAPGPGSKVHSLFYDSELYDEYLIPRLFYTRKRVLYWELADELTNIWLKILASLVPSAFIWYLLLFPH